MEYIKKLLSANEEILFKTRRHFFVIFGQIIKEILILIALGIAWFAIYQWAEAEYSTIFQLLVAAVAVIVLISMFLDLLRWSRDSFYVTTRRVIQVSGVLNKNVLDSSLSKINDVILRQSWMGRIFNYGTIKILTATEEVVNLLDRINNPMGFKRAMLDAKTVLEPAPIGPGISSSSATQLLEELSQLKAKNMISEAEYEEKRKEILGRM